jgi:hypothetical protein
VYCWQPVGTTAIHLKTKHVQHANEHMSCEVPQWAVLAPTSSRSEPLEHRGAWVTQAM